MKILVCAYRDWAKEIVLNISCNKKITIIDHIKDQQHLLKVISDDINVDLILFIGWSWILPDEVTKNYLCVGIHPSDLPHYKGGSPIQNQIINGVAKSKVTLFTLSPKLDGGDIWLKEDVNFLGNNMNEIFNSIVNASTRLLNSFFNQYPDIKPIKQNPDQGSYFKRRKPNESKLSNERLMKMNTKELYDFIRCLTDPYPNAYYEDNNGDKVFFEEIDFLKK